MRELGSPNPAQSLLHVRGLTGPDAEVASGGEAQVAAPFFALVATRKIKIWFTISFSGASGDP